MVYIKPELLTKIKQIDLLTYLKNYQPERLKKISHDTFCIRDHDSLHISNGLWNWQSMSIGGKSALDFLIKVENFSFLDACEIIANNVSLKEPDYIPYTEKEKDRKLQKPRPERSNQKAIDYLLSRGIAYDVIHYCIAHYLIYETTYQNKEDLKKYSNVAFVGYEKETQKMRYVALRGINSDFIGEASGSVKRFSFCIESDDVNCDTVHVCEAPIDALSMATLVMLDNKKFNHEHILSLAGIYSPKKETKEIKIPVALQQFLKDHSQVKSIVFHLDLDKVGRRATNMIIEMMKKQMPEYHCSDDPPKHYKDMNDVLCIKLGIKRMMSRENKKDEKQER